MQQIAKSRRMSVTEVRAVFDELNIDPRSITSRTNWEINHYVDILRFIVTICTSFLMTDGADRYFQQFIKAFKTKQAYIPLGTIKELNSNLKNAVPEKRQRARRAASIVRDLLAEGMVEGF